MRDYLSKTNRLFVCAVAWLTFGIAMPAVAQDIPAGVDCFTTTCGEGTVFQFGTGGIPFIPADFFGPGSDPFQGAVEFGGPGGFPGDTQVLRLAEADLSGPLPASDTIPIEIIALDLVACQPITVTFNGGQNPEPWDVRIQLDGPQQQGSMTIHKTVPEGGTLDSVLPVQPLFIFIQLNPPFNQGFLPGPPITLVANGMPWRTDTLPGITCTPGFSPTLCTDPGGKLCCVISCHDDPANPGGHQHCITMPDCNHCPPDPNCPPPPSDLGIPTVSEWGLVVMVLLLLTAGTIVFARRRTTVKVS